MEHGAVIHHSKEQMILSGRYNKPLGKRTYRKLRKCGVKNANITYNDIISKKCLGNFSLNSNSSEMKCLTLSSLVNNSDSLQEDDSNSETSDDEITASKESSFEAT